MAADATIDRYALPDDMPIGELVTDLHPNGQLIVASGALGTAGTDDAVAVIDLASDEVVWEYDPWRGLGRRASLLLARWGVGHRGRVMGPGLDQGGSAAGASRSTRRDRPGRTDRPRH